MHSAHGRRSWKELGKLRLHGQGSAVKGKSVSWGRALALPAAGHWEPRAHSGPRAACQKARKCCCPSSPSRGGAVLGTGLTSLPPSQWCEPADTQRRLSTLPGLPRGPPALGTVPGERLWGRRAPPSPGWHELTTCCCRPWPLLSSCLAGEWALRGKDIQGAQALESGRSGRGPHLVLWSRPHSVLTGNMRPGTKADLKALWCWPTRQAQGYVSNSRPEP